MFADSGHRRVTKREGIQSQEHEPEWHISMMSSKRK